MSSSATSSDDDGSTSDSDGSISAAPAITAAAALTADATAAATTHSTTSKKKRGRPPKNLITGDGLNEGGNAVGGGGEGRGAASDHKKARLHEVEPSSSSSASTTSASTFRDEQQPQTIEEIAASPYAAHMGIFLGHRIVKDFSKKGDPRPENYLGTVVAYCPPWTPAFGASDSDEAKGTRKSGDAYNDFAAFWLLLWKGDDADSVVDGDNRSGSGEGEGNEDKAGKLKRNNNKKKNKSTKTAVELRSLGCCRKGRKLGETPGLYRVLFDDGDFEDAEPTDVYEGALKYHKMVRNVKSASSNSSFKH